MIHIAYFILIRLTTPEENVSGVIAAFILPGLSIICVQSVMSIDMHEDWVLSGLEGSCCSVPVNRGCGF